MSDEPKIGDGSENKHQQAREVTEQAIRAQAEGDEEKADALFSRAAEIDPDAAVDALQDATESTGATGADATPASDDEVAAMTRTVQPGSDAPSRSGISGRGSGADNQ